MCGVHFASDRRPGLGTWFPTRGVYYATSIGRLRGNFGRVVGPPH